MPDTEDRTRPTAFSQPLVSLKEFVEDQIAAETKQVLGYWTDR